MTVPVDTVKILQDALTFLEEAGASHHDQDRVGNVRERLRHVLAEITSANRVRCLKDLGSLIDASPETARRTLLRLFPDTAKRRGRFKITPEMVAAVVADRS